MSKKKVDFVADTWFCNLLQIHCKLQCTYINKYVINKLRQHTDEIANDFITVLGRCVTELFELYY